MLNAISLVQVWTCVAVSISYDDNHYTTGTSLHHGHLQNIYNYNKDFNSNSFDR